MKNFKTITVIKETVMFVATIVSVIGFGFTLAFHTTSTAPTAYAEAAGASIYDNVGPSVVVIEVTRQGPNPYGLPFPNEDVGYGFLVDSQGLILTNNHVVDGASNVQVVLKSGNTVDAKVVSTDAADDLALISIDSTSVLGITPLGLGDSSAVKPGQMAMALGGPNSMIAVVPSPSRRATALLPVTNV
ncbi:MAG: trypsin-like peptidase domain-containing protein [Dehalococcoidia bacterium]|jgi:S1-C subfamily serine protease